MNRIKELRISRGVSQKELCSAISIAQPTVSQWEQGGKEPSRESAARLADFFGVSIDYLLGRKEADDIKEVTILTKERLANDEQQLIKVWKSINIKGRRFLKDLLNTVMQSFPIDTTPLTPEEEEELRLELDKVIEEQDAQKTKRGKRRVHG